MYEKRITSVCTRSYTFAEQSARWEWKIERETGADWNRIGDCCYETQVSEKNKNATSFRMWCKVREKSVHITDAQLHACVRLALSVCVWFVCTFHGSQNTKWNERARARVRIAKEPMTKTPSHQHILQYYYSVWWRRKWWHWLRQSERMREVFRIKRSMWTGMLWVNVFDARLNGICRYIILRLFHNIFLFQLFAQFGFGAFVHSIGVVVQHTLKWKKVAFVGTESIGSHETGDCRLL